MGCCSMVQRWGVAGPGCSVDVQQHSPFCSASGVQLPHASAFLQARAFNVRQGATCCCRGFAYAAGHLQVVISTHVNKTTFEQVLLMQRSLCSKATPEVR